MGEYIMQKYTVQNLYDYGFIKANNPLHQYLIRGAKFSIFLLLFLNSTDIYRNRVSVTTLSKLIYGKEYI